MEKISTSTCLCCGEDFDVTKTMVDEARAASGYSADETDSDIANIIEVCLVYAGIEAEDQAGRG